MTRGVGFAVGAPIVGVGFLCGIGLGASLADGQQGFTLPADFATYRSWTSLIEGSYGVPMELRIRCSRPSAGEWEAARRKFGPHMKLSIRVYANPTAADAFVPGAAGPLPVASIIAKEKLAHDAGEVAEGVAFMVKHRSPAFPATAGWEFRYFPAGRDTRRTHEACAACHRAASAKDYVFGRHPRSSRDRR